MAGVDPATGAGQASIGFQLPRARGQAQPSLGVSYSSANGSSTEVGYAWSLNLPRVERENRGGGPLYTDEDRFRVNGVELIPICQVAGGQCFGGGSLLPGEKLPDDVTGWRYFKTAIDDGNRYFLSSDGRTWRVDSKSGVQAEYGVPWDDKSNFTGIDIGANDADAKPIAFRWNLVRLWGNGRANVVVYRWEKFEGEARGYLVDIFDTPHVGAAVSTPAQIPLGQFAHHTHLAYSFLTPEQGEVFPRAALWRARPARHLEHVDVTSADFNDAGGGRRHLVRRYMLRYSFSRLYAEQVRSMLDWVHLTGACPDVVEDDNFVISTALCETEKRELAKMWYTGFGSMVLPRQQVVKFAHPYIERGNQITFVDLDADGTADVISKPEAEPNGGPAKGPMTVGVQMTPLAYNVKSMDVQAPDLLGANASNLLVFGKLGSWNPDGRVNFLWWKFGADAITGQYMTYSPRRNSDQSWSWVGGPVHDASDSTWVKLSKYPNTHLRDYLDFDGDGNIDSQDTLIMPADEGVRAALPTKPKPTFEQCTFFTKRDATGNVLPFSRGPSETACTPTSQSPEYVPPQGQKFYADFSGDGIPDQLTLRWVRGSNDPNGSLWDQEWRVSYGTGNGSFSGGRIVDGGVKSTFNWFIANTYIHDLNGDGIGDRIDLRNTAYKNEAGDPLQDPQPGIDISFGDGTKWLAPIHLEPASIPNWSTMSEFAPRQYYQPMQLQFADHYGIGIDNLLVTTQTSSSKDDMLVYSFVDARPGLLESITNGLGATTKLEYRPTPRVAGGHHHVHQVTVSSTADVKGTGGPYVTYYAYDDPVYDYVERQFRGFRRVNTYHGAVDDLSKAETDTTYLFGACQDGSGKDVPCTPAVDNPRLAIRGLPVSVEHKSNNGWEPDLSRSHQQYKMDKLYDGLDGRKVRRVYANKSDIWVYSLSDFNGGGETADMPALVSDEVSLSGRVYLGMKEKRGHITTTRELDVFGNRISATDYGNNEATGSGTAPDTPIVSIADWSLPAGDTTHWLWRAKDSYVRESLSGPNLRHSHYEYDATGNLLKTFADLSGTLLLTRSHENDSADVAPTPSDASHDGANLLRSEMTYDAFGNPRRVKNATGMRCVDTSYDAAYGQLPVSQTAYKNGCGSGGLTTTTVYDRGLEAPTMITDPTGATSTTTYDGWGRPKSIFKPNPTLGVLADSTASAKMTYFDVEDGPYQKVLVETRNDDGSLEPRYRSAWSYTDPYGHAVATIKQADPAAGDAGPYVVRGQVERDVHGFIVKVYEPYFADVNPNLPTPPAVPANVLSSRAVYDSFGRVIQTFGLEGEPKTKVLYHALWQETFDAADLAAGATPHPNKTALDGHGRVVLKQRATNATGGTTDTISTQMAYLPTGELATVTRSHSAGSDVYTRTMSYDSWGRLVQNAEPNTSKGFGTTSMKAWRYAYNDSGDVVGTSDARGCGKNAAWDGLGRLLSETYSPCLRSHAAYQRDRVTNLFVYDAPEQGQEGNGQFFIGRLAAAYDRAQRTRFTYDGRGRTTLIARQIALAEQNGRPFDGGEELGAGTSTDLVDDAALAAGYASRWYKTAVAYDPADRIIAQTMGLEVPEMQGQPVTAGGLTGKDLVTTSYTIRGIANRVGGSYGDLTTRKIVDADGLLRSVTYGDIAGTEASYFYDTRRRLQRALIRRNPADIWSNPPAGYTKPSTSETAQTVLQDLTIDSFDAVDNPLQVSDARIATEWPAGAKPIATKKFTYDDLYQLRRVEYGTGDDVQVSPFAYEASNDDTRPIPEQKLAQRVKWQSFDFDWQGNLTKSDDDAHAFHDRSMGAMVYGTPSNGPNRVAAANAEKGHATASYDPAGNLTGLTLTKPATDPDNGSIDLAFSYEWDEVGRLVRAKRKPVLGVATGVEFRYTYDAGGQRVIKSVEDPRSHERVYSVAIFPTLRLNDARFRSNEYELNEDTATAYLVSNGATLARVVHGDPKLPTIGEKKARVYFVLSDPLGSTSAVIDKSTSELVERSTYLAFGQAETDYRPKRWQSFREDNRFTGKEDDVGVGLTYFGHRYYVAMLGQWASADPLTVHGLGSDLNPYAYVLGSPQRLTDPLGLLAPSNPTTTNAGVPGDSYSAGGFIPWSDGSGGGCLRGLDGGFSCAAEEVTVGGGKQPAPPGGFQSPQDSARAWSKWMFEVDRYAAIQAAEPHGWGDSGSLILQGGWNGVLGGVAAAISLGDPTGGTLGELARLGQEELSFEAPTTPSALADYEAGYYVLPSAGAILEAVGLGAAAAAEAAGGLIGVGSGGCFTAGTLVTTCDSGQQPIETIRSGDRVLSWNEKTGTVECKPVAQTTVRVSNELVDLGLLGPDGRDHVVHTTVEHPFWVSGKGWTRAGDLLPGDEARDRDGAWVSVKVSKRLDGQAQVFNFEVAGNHSYFVSDAQVLVHNTCPIDIVISSEKYPEAASHIADAQAAGQPSVLTIERAGAGANRQAATGGFEKVPGKHLDEYPPAMFKEGGAGASVRAVDPRQNTGAGACIGNACRGLPDGTKVRIVVE